MGLTHPPKISTEYLKYKFIPMVDSIWMEIWDSKIFAMAGQRLADKDHIWLNQSAFS